MIQWDRVDNLRRTTLWQLRDMGILDGYYLSGGTGLALHLGHRISVDLDLFSRTPRTTLAATAIIEECQASFGVAHVQIVLRQADQLGLHLNGVQVTFLAWPFRHKYPLVGIDGVEIADARDIMAQKAYAMGRRVSARDYVDVACALRAGAASLDQMMRDAEEVFIVEGQHVFERGLFLQQIVYTDDLIDKEAAIRSLHAPTAFADIAAFLRREVQSVARKNLSLLAATHIVAPAAELRSWPSGYIRSSTGMLHLRSSPHSPKTLCGRAFGALERSIQAASLPARARFCHICSGAVRGKAPSGR